MSAFSRFPRFEQFYASDAEFERVWNLAEQSFPSQTSILAGPDAEPGGSARRQSALHLPKIGAKILPEAEGSIDVLLLMVPKFDHPSGCGFKNSRLRRHFEKLFASFPEPVRFVIVAGPCQHAEILRWCKDQQVSPTRIQFVQSPFSITPWAQDPFIVLKSRSEQVILCEGVSFQRLDDMTVADNLALQAQCEAVLSNLVFQGGNILGGTECTLIGHDFILANCGRYGMPSTDAVINSFQELFGTDVVVLGGRGSGAEDFLKRGVISGRGSQPIFHIDMYVTRTGCLGPSGRELVLLGRPKEAHRVTGKYSDVPGLNNHVYDALFEQTEAQLSDRFEVRHLPLWLTYGNLNERQNPARFYPLTWNNAVVESAGQTKRVLLPNYTNSYDAVHHGVDVGVRIELQACAEEIWRSLDFEVRLTDGLEDMAFDGSAVHCMIKVLKRGQSPPLQACGQTSSRGGDSRTL